MNYCEYIILFGLFISSITCMDWNYDEQDKWPELCNTGTSQSPVDLSSEGIVEEMFEQFVFHNYDVDFSGIVTNNGHTVTLQLTDTDSPPTIERGGLTKEYTLDHLHFHWGSEHTHNNRRYPLEVHLVHFASEYENVSAALDYDDGVAVLGVFYELSPDDDIYFEPLMKIMENVTEIPDTSAEIETVDASRFLPRDTAGFYRYNGSLTTPGCNEVVIWTIFTNTLPISKKQINEFQLVHSDEGVLNRNFRPIQDLNGRLIYLKRSPLPILEEVEPPKETSEDTDTENIAEDDHVAKETECHCENSASFAFAHSLMFEFGLLIYIKMF